MQFLKNFWATYYYDEDFFSENQTRLIPKSSIDLYPLWGACYMLSITLLMLVTVLKNPQETFNTLLKYFDITAIVMIPLLAVLFVALEAICLAVTLTVAIISIPILAITLPFHAIKALWHTLKPTAPPNPVEPEAAAEPEASTELTNEDKLEKLKTDFSKLCDEYDKDNPLEQWLHNPTINNRLDKFTCPVSRNLMTYPMRPTEFIEATGKNTYISGHCYERTTLMQYCQQKRIITDPLTRRTINTAIPAPEIKKQCDDLIQELQKLYNTLKDKSSSAALPTVDELQQKFTAILDRIAPEEKVSNVPPHQHMSIHLMNGMKQWLSFRRPDSQPTSAQTSNSTLPTTSP
jgi:hypothetical protein